MSIRCNCVLCETIGFDDIPTTLKRMIIEIPDVIKKIQNLKQKLVKLTTEDEIYFIRIEAVLNHMINDAEMLYVKTSLHLC